jgi:aldehyde dehydrogenase family 7 member A1
MFLARSGRTFARNAYRTRFLSSRASDVLSALDIPTTPTELNGVYDGTWKGSGELLTSVCPTTGEVLARIKTVRISSLTRKALLNLVTQASPQELHEALGRSREAYLTLRRVPAPQRGEIIRQIREALFAKVSTAFSDLQSLTGNAARTTWGTRLA